MKNITVTLSVENKKMVWKKSWILSTKKVYEPCDNMTCYFLFLHVKRLIKNPLYIIMSNSLINDFG